MNTSEINSVKSDLHRLIVETEDLNLLKKIKDIIDILRADDTIVAYAVGGKPLTRKEYVEAILESEEDVRAGRVYTPGQVREEMEKWKAGK